MTASLGEVVQRIRAALDLAQQVEALLDKAEQSAREAAALLAPIGNGSSHEAEYHEAMTAWTTTADEADRHRQLLGKTRQVLERYLTDMNAPNIPGPTPTQDPVDAVQSAAGDRYPSEAWWGAPLKERHSPPGSKVPVHGFARSRGSSGPALPFRPGDPY